MYSGGLRKIVKLRCVCVAMAKISIAFECRTEPENNARFEVYKPLERSKLYQSANSLFSTQTFLTNKKQKLKMFKLVVLCSMIAVCMAAPSGLYDHAPLIKTVEYASHPVVTAHTQTILKPSLSARTVIENNPVVVETPITKHVGDVVQHIPTAVSHQSSTIVHSSAKHGKFPVI